jgi:hypothetical protein
MPDSRGDYGGDHVYAARLRPSNTRSARAAPSLSVDPRVFAFPPVNFSIRRTLRRKLECQRVEYDHLVRNSRRDGRPKNRTPDIMMSAMDTSPPRGRDDNTQTPRGPKRRCAGAATYRRRFR